MTAVSPGVYTVSVKSYTCEILHIGWKQKFPAAETNSGMRILPDVRCGRSSRIAKENFTICVAYSRCCERFRSILPKDHSDRAP